MLGCLIKSLAVARSDWLFTNAISADSLCSSSDLEILQLRVGKIDGQFAKVGTKTGLVHSVGVPPVQ